MEQNGTLKPTCLTDRQLAALPYLVASPSFSEAASRAAVGRATLYRWMEDDEFRARLKRLRSEAADLAHVELQGLMLKCILILADSLDDPDPDTRLRAARATMHIGLKATDLKDLHRRLDRFDDAFTLWLSRNPGP